VGTMERRRLVEWSFGHYLRIAPPEFAGPAPAPQVRRGAGAGGRAAA